MPLAFTSNGDGTFTDVSVTSGLAEDATYSVGCSFGDINGDGLLDVAIANSFDVSNQFATGMPEPFALNQHPVRHPLEPGSLWYDRLMANSDYSLIAVGTGFASTFFVKRYLQRAGADVRVLFLERGGQVDLDTQIKLQPQALLMGAMGSYVNKTPHHPWIFNLFLGGSSNTWTGNTPRHLPEDFELKTRFGIDKDWPVSYDDLESSYCDAEDIMVVAGDSKDTPFPRSRPYPQLPHIMSDPDKLLKKAHPEDFFALPSARPSATTKRRMACCTAGVCTICPIDSKFTVINDEVGDLFKDPRVTLILDAKVEAVDIEAGLAKGVSYTRGGKLESARGELVALGANAIMNPHILLRSGIEQAALGRGLCEQKGVFADVYLDGVDNYQGSSFHTGHGYMLHRRKSRKGLPAALIETWNAPPVLRLEPGKWRQRYMIKVIFENIPDPRSYVRPSADDPSKPEVFYAGESEYTQRGIDALPGDLEKIFTGLPVEKIRLVKFPIGTEFHVMCSTPMGDDPKTSVVDRNLVHHQVRNLLVLGSGVFPTCPPANPTPTLAALSLWAADKLTA